MRTITTLLLALVTLVAPAASVAAQQGEENEPKINVSDSQAEIVYEREIDDETARSVITFGTNNSAFGVTFDYANQSSEEENRLDVGLHQLVEYQDENGNGQFDTEEKVVSSYRLSEEAESKVGGSSNGTVEWDALNVSEATSDDGDEGKVIRAKGTFVGAASEDPLEQVTGALGESDNATFAVSIYVFGSDTSYNDTSVQPLEVLMDVQVDGYPYAKNRTDLALVSEARSDQGLENASVGENDTEVGPKGYAAPDTLEGFDVDLSYRWTETASIDGTSQTVQHSVLDDASEKNASEEDDSTKTEETFALSYPRGEEIQHTHQTGVVVGDVDNLFDSTKDEISSVPGLTAWAAMLGIVGTAALVRVRRR